MLSALANPIREAAPVSQSSAIASLALLQRLATSVPREIPGWAMHCLISISSSSTLQHPSVPPTFLPQELSAAATPSRPSFLPESALSSGPLDDVLPLLIRKSTLRSPIRSGLRVGKSLLKKRHLEQHASNKFQSRDCSKPKQTCTCCSHHIVRSPEQGLDRFCSMEVLISNPGRNYFSRKNVDLEHWSKNSEAVYQGRQWVDNVPCGQRVPERGLAISCTCTAPLQRRSRPSQATQSLEASRV